jgi:hypothetical protein
MPPGCDFYSNGGATPNISSFVWLLPYLEQQRLFEQAATGTGGLAFMPNAMGNNNFVPWRTWLSEFVCPSDAAASMQGRWSATWANNRGPGGYAANRGDWHAGQYHTASPTSHTAPTAYNGSRAGFSGNPSTFRGMFGVSTGLKFKDITDGLSFTMAYGERRIYRGETRRVPDAMWGNGNSWSAPNACSTPSVLASKVVNGEFVGSGAIVPYWPNSNNYSAWACGLAFYHGIVTAVPPNGPSCDMNGSPFWNIGLYTASSFHQGGVFAVMGDGAVRFVTDNVDAGDQSQPAGGATNTPPTAQINAPSPYGVWGAMGTRCGGETVKYRD